MTAYEQSQCAAALQAMHDLLVWLICSGQTCLVQRGFDETDDDETYDPDPYGGDHPDGDRVCPV